MCLRRPWLTAAHQQCRNPLVRPPCVSLRLLLRCFADERLTELPVAPPALRRWAVRCCISSTCTCWAATTSGCCVKASTCTRSSWWPCSPRSSICTGTTSWVGVSASLVSVLKKIFIWKEPPPPHTHTHTRLFPAFLSPDRLPLPGFPLVPASIHAVARKKYFDDK